MTDSIQDNDLSKPINETTDQPNNTILPWIRHNAKVTFTHPSLGPKPKWGYLQQDTSQHPDEAWSFIAGKNKTGNVVQIPNLRQIAHDLLTQHQLFQV